MRRWDEILKRLPAPQDGVIITGVELGVWRGATTISLLRARQDLLMIAVDLWSPEAAGWSYTSSGDNLAALPQDTFEDTYQTFVTRTRQYRPRLKILRDNSARAAKYVADASVDFVFVDADHSYFGCYNDISAWWPKVVRGGWIGGHDIDHPNFPLWGVRRAVEDYFDEAPRTGNDYTWFVRKEVE